MEINDPFAPRPSIVGGFGSGVDNDQLDEFDVPIEAGKGEILCRLHCF